MRTRSFLVGVLLVAAALTGLAAPARAGSAFGWGFAYFGDLAPPPGTVLDPIHQWGSWPQGFQVTGTRLAPGRYLVRFPRIAAGVKGIAHVSPVGRDGHYCEVLRWFGSGTDEVVEVQCHRPGGITDDSRFTVLWSVSTGVLPPGQGGFAYAQYGGGGLVQAYASTGGPVTVAPDGVGRYELRVGGVGGSAELTGNPQVTAIQMAGEPRRCKVDDWRADGTDVVVWVACYDQTGAPVDAEFGFSYHRERAVFGSLGPPKFFGYVQSKGTGQTNFNHALGGFGFNTVTESLPAGRYVVKYPQLGTMETHAQVVAMGPGAGYCEIAQLWTNAVVEVACFDAAGNSAPQGFLSTFTSRM